MSKTLASLYRAPARMLWLLLLLVLGWTVPSGPAAAQDTYRIQPGDTIRVEVFEDTSLNRDLTVLPDGSVNFPFAGTVEAAGRTPGEVQTALTNGIASNFATRPTVFVSVPRTAPVPEAAPPAAAAAPEIPTIAVYFLGEVASPGLQELAVGTTFLQALAQGGGFTNFAAQKRLQLRRTDPATGRQNVYTIDYRALANGAQLSRDITLIDGDVILVPERRLFE